MAEWWVFAHGKEMGPVTVDQLIGLARTHGVAGIYVWREGFDDWQPLGEVAELRSRPNLVPDRPVAGVVHPSLRRRSTHWSIVAVLIGIAAALVLYALHGGVWEQAAQLLKSPDAGVAINEPKPVDPPPADAAPSRDEIAGAIAAAAPALQTLKEKYPAQFDALVDEYVDAISKGSTPVEAMENVSGKLATFVLSLLRQADDDILIDYNKLLVDQLGAFNAKNPTWCYQYASGRGFSPVIFRELPADIRLRDRELQERVLRTAREHEGAQQDVVQRGLASVRRQLEEAQADISVLNIANLDSDRHGEYCEATIRFFSEIGKLPEQDKVAVMRFILAARR